MDRKSALQVTEYKAFGGTFFDSISHAAMFRDEKAFDFGVMTAGLFSSTKMMGLTNKRWSGAYGVCCRRLRKRTKWRPCWRMSATMSWVVSVTSWPSKWLTCLMVIKAIAPIG